MKAFIQFIFRILVSGSATVLTWLVSFFGFDQDFLLSGLYALLGGAIVYFGIKGITHYRLLKTSGLTNREYKIIRRSLKEARPKIQRLQKSLLNVRSLANAKQNIELYRIVNKIYSVTKREPRRFFLVEEFYYKHLDSLVELSEKYVFLSSQPAKTKELTSSLLSTRRTIEKLSDSVKDDLYTMLEGDIDTLEFELDVAKQTIERKEDKDRNWRFFK